MGTGKVLLSNNKTYDISVSICIRSLRISPTVFVFDSGPGADIVKTDVLDTSSLDRIRHCYMPYIFSASNTKLWGVSRYNSPSLYGQITQLR